MKYSLTACLLLFFGIASAQLSVRNNAYVFVQDQVLFVNDDVNLNEAESKVYLRDEAQLIQGAGTTGNSGVGELSVYQEGNVNQWSYNYWCSPVGNNSVAFGNENARVSLIDDATGISSTIDPLGLTSSADALFTPDYNGIASPLTISDRWLYTYETSSLYTDWVYVGSGGPIKPGLGFTMKGMGEGVIGNQLYDFRGKPNNGNITNLVVDGQWTLIGNPYPSALDARELIHDPSNINEIDGTLFYWDQSGTVPSHVLQEYVGGYATYTIDFTGTLETFNFALFFTYDEQDNSTPVLTPPPGSVQATGIKVASRYIPIGQGFMVEGINGPDGLVTVRNSHRKYETLGINSTFFRNSISENVDAESDTGPIQYQNNGLSLVPYDYQRFRVNVDFTVGEIQYTRQLVLNFHDSATMGHDRGLELKLAQSYDSDAYFELNDKDYSGQAYPFSQDLSIPLIVDIEQQQPLRFRIFDIQNFEESHGIYIHDLENDTYVNLRNQNYELNIAPGHYTERFEIVFTAESALSIADLEAQSLSINQNNSSNLLVVSNPKKLDLNSIEVYDISGKRLLDQNYKTISNRYELSTSNLSDGVYVVNVLSKSNNKIKSQKIIVKN